jgi:hypothetical protein
LYAAANGEIDAINATTGALMGSYTSGLGGTLYINAVQPVGDLLYIAGLWTQPADDEFFGVYNTSTSTLTSLSPPVANPQFQDGQFLTIALLGGDVYFGGGLFSYTYSPVGATELGYFYRYDPATGTVTNLSSLLPIHGGAMLWTMVPWKSTIVLCMGAFSVTTSTSTEWGGIYKLGSSGKTLNNISGYLPSNFAAYPGPTASTSGGFFYEGGQNAMATVGKVVAIRI